MAKKPVKLPSAAQLQAYRLRRKLGDYRDQLRSELFQADFFSGSWGRDKVLARHLNGLATQVATAVQSSQKHILGVAEHVAMLADQMASQSLLLQAMLTYLEESPEFDKARFHEILTALDAADGEVDGKLGQG